MNASLAKKLCEITNAFYRDNASSFSATRTSPWNGWKTSMEFLGNEGLLDSEHLDVLDLASGNLRFAAFLADAYPQLDVTMYAVDDCADLAISYPNAHIQNLDITAHLLEGAPLAELIEAPLCDVSICFGFMHHVPGRENRARVLEALLDKTNTGGFVIVSFWMFLNNEALAKKAAITHAQALRALSLSEAEIAALDEGDYFLGWKDTTDSYRYCHNFTDADIDALIASVERRAHVAARFIADGRTNNLNDYVILQKTQ